MGQFAKVRHAENSQPLHREPMAMNSGFATTMAVVIPVILLSLAVQMREFESRTRTSRVYDQNRELKEIYSELPDWDETLRGDKTASVQNLIDNRVSSARKSR
jgi:hypothetical protein